MARKRDRRQRIIVEGFQLQFVMVSLLWLAVTLFLFLGVLFGPPAALVLRSSTSEAARVEAASRLIALHEHAWPAVLVALASGTLFLVRHSHRLAGPIYRFRATFARVAAGDLTPRVRLRKGDYLVDEAAALDAMIRSLARRVDRVRDDVAAAAAAAHARSRANGEDVAVIVAALARVRESLDGLATCGDGPVATAEPAKRAAPATPLRLDKERGFTLVEALVAVAIVGTLFAMGGATYARALEKARTTRAIADIRSLDREIAAFYLVQGRLPASLAEIQQHDTLDPWGNRYEYLVLVGMQATAGGNGGQSNSGSRAGGTGQDVAGLARKDRALVPINSDFDLYSKGPDGLSQPPLTVKVSQDDIVRASDGGFVGIAAEY